MSNIYIPAKEPEDWKQFLAEPCKHWKDGHSAKELAKAWQNANGFPADVINALKNSGIDLFQNIELLIAIPEHKVPLPGGIRPSQNDIFVLAKGRGQLISITVEGKVSESFGPVVSEWLKDASQGKQERLGYLCKILDIDISKVNNIRYQLLHRTASALIEAERFNAQNALMLVHSFSNTNEGFEDYLAFSSLFDVKPDINSVSVCGKANGIDLYIGWVRSKI